MGSSWAKITCYRNPMSSKNKAALHPCHTQSLADTSPWNDKFPYKHSDEFQNVAAGVIGQLYSLQLEKWETTLMAAIPHSD